MMTTNLFVIANVKQLRTGGSFRILLPFFSRTCWGVGVLNSAIFNSFHNRVEFGTILEGLRNFGGGEGRLKPPLGTPLWLHNERYAQTSEKIPAVRNALGAFAYRTVVTLITEEIHSNVRKEIICKCT